MRIRRTKPQITISTSRQPMFRAMRGGNSAVTSQPFFSATPQPVIQRLGTNQVIIQREESNQPEEKKEEKDPLLEGLKTTGEKLLENPKFKVWFEPKLDLLKKRLWEERPSDEKAALLTFGSVNLALAGLVFALNPEVQKLLSDVNVGKPLGAIPYSPIEGFKYKLPEPGKSTYGFSGEFTFNPYLELLRNRYPQVPLTGATFGLDTGYTRGKGVSLTGGKFGLEFFGGGLKAEGKSFTELSPYPLFLPGASPFQPSTTLMQSYPELPALQIGPGFQFIISADLYKLFPKFTNLF
jgi:hypothetical protein